MMTLAYEVVVLRLAASRRSAGMLHSDWFTRGERDIHATNSGLPQCDKERRRGLFQYLPRLLRLFLSIRSKPQAQEHRRLSPSPHRTPFAVLFASLFRGLLETTPSAMLTLIFLVALAGLSRASDVLDLTDDDFDSSIEHLELTLVEFYAPW